ncbi:acetyl/propionyl-CoA carboxylase, alpha subunit [Desulfosporosinus orientis DSM 765]|uniref:Acetyl/propionyl-CoA carboxylase, alpha subunit n=1 Tax=Desulfosporosinus orientis (strain ATCC 19365 / DSM 765 / NCIMB 8382 / VKM B-1628 / Singapore I) TaxID=768706 RepID=G7W713_DESOD|nr:biotin/lipoyl-containing protein [Desulfosporosinus orientis]AET69870.1 acetyl/propionyl-CoA carboxylase, alpha subunit [Desulfosporosinus orientis DSM 765]
MMKYNVIINGKKFEVEVEKSDEGNDQAKSTGKKVMEASVNVAEKYRDACSSEATGTEETIAAPMPGTIVTLKVNEGQTVKKGEVLLILEAMKMENEIMAPRDAVVSKLLVASGTSVKTGDMLLLLK